MPSNIVRINDSDDLEWQVDDSEMEKVFEALNEWGFKTNDEGNIKEEEIKNEDC